MTMHLSPSENHKYLLSKIKPSMSFQGGEFRPWQGKLRRKLRELLGEFPERRPSLRVRSLWKREHPLGTIEKLVFTSEPKCDVPAYVCLPKNIDPPYAFVICLQGHSSGMHNSIGVQKEDETQPMDVPGDRDFGLGCMRRGVAALCIEQRSFGERKERKQECISQNGCHDATAQALLLGRTLIGERVFDVDRGIDYLASRGDADMSNVGVMGNSGGGTTALFAAALLPRIAYAMPSCYFCTFADSLMSIYHCMDNYIPGLLKYAEMSDVAGLIAPKPLVLVAGVEDPIFPIGGTRRAFKELKKIYAASGFKDRCHLVEGAEGHRFYANEAWPVLLDEIERLKDRKQVRRRVL